MTLPPLRCLPKTSLSWPKNCLVAAGTRGQRERSLSPPAEQLSQEAAGKASLGRFVMQTLPPQSVSPGTWGLSLNSPPGLEAELFNSQADVRRPLSSEEHQGAAQLCRALGSLAASPLGDLSPLQRSAESPPGAPCPPQWAPLVASRPTVDRVPMLPRDSHALEILVLWDFFF